MSQSKVFLSYSHQDEVWKERLASHLAVLAEEGLLAVWDDRRIGAGDDWEAEIRRAMGEAHVAILLISKDFLTSPFVLGTEIPLLLQRRSKEGVRLIPIVLHSCMWKEVPWLAKLQMRPRDGTPLASFHGDRVDKELVAITGEVLKHLQRSNSGEEAPRIIRGPAVERRAWLSNGADWIQRKPAAAIALATGFCTAMIMVLGVLGLLVQRAREGLIGIPPLSYPNDQLLLTGADALWSLLWRALVSLVAPHPGLHWSAAVLLVLTVALIVEGWSLRKNSRAFFALALSAGILGAGAWLYSAAIQSSLDPPTPGYGLDCAKSFSRALDESSAFETCTWLTNDTSRNQKRRQGLGGILGLLLLASSSAIWLGARWKALGPRFLWARRGLLLFHGVLVVFFLRLVPPAHAYATWGVSYPPVTLRIDRPGCDQTLAQAISQGACCAYDVSQGAEGVALFLWGSGCPGDNFVSPRAVEAMGKGCLIEARSPRSINSQCL